MGHFSPFLAHSPKFTDEFSRAAASQSGEFTLRYFCSLGPRHLLFISRVLMKFSLFLGMIPSSWRLLKCLKKNQRALTEMYAACRNPNKGRIELIKVKLKTIVLCVVKVMNIVSLLTLRNLNLNIKKAVWGVCPLVSPE